jgi:hypothetical protein
MGDVGADLLETARVKQPFDPLPGRQFAPGMLLLDSLNTAPLPDSPAAAEQFIIPVDMILWVIGSHWVPSSRDKGWIEYVVRANGHADSAPL